MSDKITIMKRDNEMYPYAIQWLGQPQVLLTKEDLKKLYEEIDEIILDNIDLW